MTQPTSVFAIANLIFGLVVIILNTRGQRGAIFAPFNLTVFLLVSIFAVRPLYMLADQDFYLYGLNAREGFTMASLLGSIALACIAFGYYFSGRRAGRGAYPDEVADPKPKHRYSMYRAAGLSLAMNGAWFVIIAGRGGGSQFIGTIFDGRNETTNAALIGLPAAVGALPTAGAIIVGFVRISMERERSLYVGERLAFWLVILASLVPPLALGGRRYLLPCLVAAAIAVTAKNYQRRVGLRHIGLGFVGFLFLAIVPFVRSTGSRGDSTNIAGAMADYFGREGLVGSLKPFFTSYDTEMFSYIALMVSRVGTTIPYGWGRGTIGDMLLNPLPASVSPYPLWSNQILINTYGTSCGQGVCPVPSFVGVLYYDLGLVGVAFGSCFIGYACRRYPEWLAKSGDYRLLLIFGVAAFMPVLVRGNTINLGYIAFTTILMCALIVRLSRGRREAVVAPDKARSERAQAGISATG